MKYIKQFETFNMTAFFHGSGDRLPDNTVLKPHKDSYTRQKDEEYLENILEKYRPSDKLSRFDSVYLVDNLDNLELVGANTDFVYEVIVPSGIIPEKSDLSWYTEIETTDDQELQKQYALNYWNGIQFNDINRSLWEYRVPKAYIIDLIEEN
jgi:hypothetical protein